MLLRRNIFNLKVRTRERNNIQHDEDDDDLFEKNKSCERQLFNMLVF